MVVELLRKAGDGEDEEDRHHGEVLGALQE
jgi:hypothetical protein